MKTLTYACLALAAVFSLTTSAKARVFVRAPFVTVQVGPAGGVYVRAPFVNLQTPPRAIVYPAPPIIAAPDNATEVLPAPRPDNLNPPPVKAPRQAPSLGEFASTFKPSAGTYDAVVMHPATRQPVSFTFTLPAGTPRRIRVQRNEITFIYPSARNDVSIRFLNDGRVQITQ